MCASRFARRHYFCNGVSLLVLLELMNKVYLHCKRYCIDKSSINIRKGRTGLTTEHHRTAWLISLNRTAWLIYAYFWIILSSTSLGWPNVSVQFHRWPHTEGANCPDTMIIHSHAIVQHQPRMMINCFCAIPQLATHKRCQ